MPGCRSSVEQGPAGQQLCCRGLTCRDERLHRIGEGGHASHGGADEDAAPPLVKILDGVLLRIKPGILQRLLARHPARAFEHVSTRAYVCLCVCVHVQTFLYVCVCACVCPYLRVSSLRMCAHVHVCEFFLHVCAHAIQLDDRA